MAGMITQKACKTREARRMTESEKLAELKAALQQVLQWLDRKPTPEGKTYGHGSQEIKALIERAMK